MGTIRRRGAVWRAEVFRRGIRESRTFRTRQQGVDWIARRELEISDDTRPAARFTFAQAVAKLLEEQERSKYDKLRLTAFTRLPWASLPIGEVDSQVIARWRDQRLKEVTAGTVLREITVLRSLFAVAKAEWKWIDANPVSDVRKPKAPPPRKVAISDAERDELIRRLGFDGQRVETIAHETAVALLLSLETGMRAGEILALRPEHVSGAVAVVVKSKTGPGRDVPLSKRAVELLKIQAGAQIIRRRRALDGRLFHVGSASLDVTFRRARDAEPAMPRLHFHDARATAITRLSKVLDPLELARMVGHSDLSSLMIYYRPAASEIAERLG
jgi:integrase